MQNPRYSITDVTPPGAPPTGRKDKVSELESDIEDYLKVTVKRAGGYCFKLPPASFVGLPDRLVLLPGGKVGFCELKRDRTKEPRPNQALWLRRLREMGIPSGWCFDRPGVDSFVRCVAA